MKDFNDYINVIMEERKNLPPKAMKEVTDAIYTLLFTKDKSGKMSARSILKKYLDVVDPRQAIKKLGISEVEILGGGTLDRFYNSLVAESEQQRMTVDGVVGRKDSYEDIFLVSAYDLGEQLVGSKYDNEETDEEARNIIREAEIRNIELQKQGGFAGIPSEEYAKETAMIRRWVDANNAYFYAAPKEDFFLSNAIDEAKEKGKRIVVLENLS